MAHRESDGGGHGVLGASEVAGDVRWWLRREIGAGEFKSIETMINPRGGRHLWPWWGGTEL